MQPIVTWYAAIDSAFLLWATGGAPHTRTHLATPAFDLATRPRHIQITKDTAASDRKFVSAFSASTRRGATAQQGIPALKGWLSSDRGPSLLYFRFDWLHPIVMAEVRRSNARPRTQKSMDICICMGFIGMGLGERWRCFIRYVYQHAAVQGGVHAIVMP